MKSRWALMLLCVPALAFSETAPGQEQNNPTGPGAAPDEIEEYSYNWVDSGHAYATERAQELTQWMDSFFRDANYQFEQAESQLRLQTVHVWDEDRSDRNKARIKGKLQLPGLSRRIELVFSGRETSGVDNVDGQSDGSVGLQVNVGEQDKSRFDATLDIGSSDIRPGVRYRYQSTLGNAFFYRYTQELEWESDDGVFTTGRVDLDQALSDRTLMRWSNRLLYGEESDGVEWRTALSMRQKSEWSNGTPYVMSYFGVVRGTSDPDITRNYRLGTLLRTNFYRPFLFAEFEPSYNWRKNRPGLEREGGWRLVLRLEIAFEKDLRRIKPRKRVDHGFPK